MSASSGVTSSNQDNGKVSDRSMEEFEEQIEDDSTVAFAELSSVGTSAADLYYRRSQAKGNFSSPGVIVSAPGDYTLSPATAGDKLSIPLSARLLQMGGSADAIVARSSHAGNSTTAREHLLQQLNASPNADLWARSEHLLIELSSQSTTSTSSPTKSRTSHHTSSSSSSTRTASDGTPTNTSAKSTEAELGSNASALSTSASSATTITSALSGMSTATPNSNSGDSLSSNDSAEETDDSADPMPAGGSVGAGSNASSAEMRHAFHDGDKPGDKGHTRISKKTSPIGSPPSNSSTHSSSSQHLHQRGTMTDLATSPDSISSSAQSSLSSSQRKARPSRRKDKASTASLQATPEESEPLSPSSSHSTPVKEQDSDSNSSTPVKGETISVKSGRGLKLTQAQHNLKETLKENPQIIPLDMRYISSASTASQSPGRNSANGSLESPSSTGSDSNSTGTSASAGSAYFPRRDKSSSSRVPASSPGPGKVRMVRQYSSEMLDSHNATHTAPEPHRFGPRSPSGSTISSSTAGATKNSTTNTASTSGSITATSSSEDLVLDSSSSSDAAHPALVTAKKKPSFFSSLFTRREKRRTVQLSSGTSKEFPELNSQFGNLASGNSSSTSGNSNSTSGNTSQSSGGIQPVYSSKKRKSKHYKHVSELSVEDDDGDLPMSRPRGNSVADVQHSKHASSEFDDFTSSRLRRRESARLGGLADLLSPRAGEHISYRKTNSSKTHTSMPSSPYESDEDNASHDGNSTSAKSTSDYIPHPRSDGKGSKMDSSSQLESSSKSQSGTRHSKNPSSDDAPRLVRRNSMDPDAAKNAFRARTGRSMGAVVDGDSPATSTTSTPSSRPFGFGGFGKDKKKDKKGGKGNSTPGDDSYGTFSSPPSPKRSSLFGMQLEMLPPSPRKGTTPHGPTSPHSPLVSPSPSASSLATFASPRSPTSLAPNSPKGDCPEILTSACQALVLMATQRPDLLHFEDAFSTTSPFSPKDKRALRLAIDDGSLDLLSETDSKMIAQTALTFLEDLPDALCTYKLFGDFLSLLSIEDEPHRLQLLHSLVWSLSRVHRATLILLVDFIVFMAGTTTSSNNNSDEFPLIIVSPEEQQQRLDLLIEFFAPAIFRSKSYSTLHASPRPYMLGELRGTNLSTAFSSAHGASFAAALHGQVPSPTSPVSHSMATPTTASGSSSAGHGANVSNANADGETNSASPATLSVNTALTQKHDGPHYNALGAPHSPRTPPLSFSDGNPLHASASALPPPTTLQPASTTPGTSPKNASLGDDLGRGPTGRPLSTTIIPPLQLPSGHGMTRSKSSNLAESSEDSSRKSIAQVYSQRPGQPPSPRGHYVSMSSTGPIPASSSHRTHQSHHSHTGNSGIPYSAASSSSRGGGNFGRAQSQYSPMTSPPTSPSSTNKLSSRSIYQACSLLKLLIDNREVACNLQHRDWVYEISPSTGACLIESGDIDYLFDLLGNPFYRDNDFAEAFLLGVGQVLAPEEILARIISKIRSGDSSRHYVRVRGAMLLKALSHWVHVTAHILAPMKSFFEDLEAVVHSSKDEEESQILSNILAELTIAASASSSYYGFSGNASHFNAGSGSMPLSHTNSKATYDSLDEESNQSSTTTDDSIATPSIDISSSSSHNLNISQIHSSSNLHSLGTGPHSIQGSISKSDPSVQNFLPHLGGYAVTNIPYTVLAQHLTLLDLEYLQALRPRTSLTDTIANFLRSPAFVAMSERFNVVSRWVQFEIVTGTSSKDRAARVLYFANVATALVGMNNFNGALALFTGMSSLNVTRMAKMMSSARKRAGKILDNLETLFNMTKNSKNYTDRLRASSLPIIPQIVLYARNVASIDENNVSFEEDGRIMNLPKFKDYLRLSYELAKYQRSSYYFSKDPSLHADLAALDPPSDDDIWSLSLRAEAKK